MCASEAPASPWSTWSREKKKGREKGKIFNVTMKPTSQDIALTRELLARESDYRLDDELMDSFLATGNVLTLVRGQNFIEVGDFDDGLYVVMEGIIRSWHWSGDREVTPSFADTGTYFFSCNPFVSALPSFYNYEACCATRLIRMPKQEFDHRVRTSLKFAHWALAMAHSQILFSERKSTVISGTAKERYEAMIKARPEIVQKVPLNIIASYLGISPQHLSRLRKEI